MKKKGIKIKVLALLLLLAVLSVFVVFKIKVGPVSNDDSLTQIEVKAGDTYYSLADDLYSQNLIKSSRWFKIYVKLFKINSLEAGKYEISPSMSIKKITKILSSGANDDLNNVSITFKEGLNIRQYGALLEENTSITKDEFIKKVQDKEYIKTLIEKYWFLSDDILNDKIYYPLEGYLYPDTYSVSINSSAETVIEKMLDNFNTKLIDFDNEIKETKYSMHEIITMSSIVELEAGTAKDRAKVSKVFYNRLNVNGETLGSDITAYYGAKMDDWSNGLGNAEYDCNGYNTRMNSKCVINGLPVGPVCNPSIESIKATIHPDSSVTKDYLFFVADCSGNTYLSKTNAEHEKIIKSLKASDKWCDN